MRVDDRDSRHLGSIVRKKIPWTHLICIMRSGHEIFFFFSTPFDSITSPDATACKSGRMLGLWGRFRCLEQVAPTEGSDPLHLQCCPQVAIAVDWFVTSFQLLCSSRIGLLGAVVVVLRDTPRTVIFPVTQRKFYPHEKSEIKSAHSPRRWLHDEIYRVLLSQFCGPWWAVKVGDPPNSAERNQSVTDSAGHWTWPEYKKDVI